MKKVKILPDCPISEISLHAGNPAQLFLCACDMMMRGTKGYSKEFSLCLIRIIFL